MCKQNNGKGVASIEPSDVDGKLTDGKKIISCQCNYKFNLTEEAKNSKRGWRIRDIKNGVEWNTVVDYVTRPRSMYLQIIRICP